MELYRYEDVQYGILNEWEELAGSYIKIEERKYKVIKKTKCGYWIKLFSCFDDKKWVSKNSKKRFAYPTKQEAMNSFKFRKKRQIEILEDKLKKAREALCLIDTKPLFKEKNEHEQ
jgi:hypothetical protein